MVLQKRSHAHNSSLLLLFNTTNEQQKPNIMKLFLPLVAFVAVFGMENAQAETLRAVSDSGMRELTGTQPEPDCPSPSDVIEETEIELVNTIMQVQGDALTSSFVGNYAYRVTGVVTAISEFGDRFWFQDTEGDGDPSTSDGALVDTLVDGAVGTLDPSADPVVYTPLAVGDIVTLTKAKVFEDNNEEQSFALNAFLNQPVTTFETHGPIVIKSRGNALPEPVLIGAGGRLPPTEDMVAGVDFWESLKGMLVKMKTPISISPTYFVEGYGSYVYTVTDHGEYTSGFSDRGTLNISPNDFNPETAMIVSINDYFDTNLPKAAVGTKFDDVFGVVAQFNNGVYGILAIEHFGQLVPSSIGPTSKNCKEDPFTMSVATYNIDFSLDYEELAGEIVTNLGFPDILALQDVPFDFNLTVFDQEIAKASGGNTYKVIQSADDNYTPIFYNPWRISQYSDAISTGFDEDTSVPYHLAAKLKFLPLQEKFDIINVRFANKNFAYNAGKFGVNQPVDELQESCFIRPAFFGDEEECINGNVNRRLAESNVVRSLIEGAGRFVSDPNKVIVLGSLQENEWVSPVVNLEGAKLKNLVNDIHYDERYSVINREYSGSSEAWDHILVSEFFCPGATAEYIHINAEFYNEDVSIGDFYDPMLACIDIPYDDDSSN